MPLRSFKLKLRLCYDEQVGQTQTYVETKKELFVRPILPRILTQGDTATLTALVHNYSDAAQAVQVSLHVLGLELNDPADQQVLLQPGEVTSVGWRVKVLTGKPTQATIRIKAGQRQDGVQLPLRIRPASVREVQTQSGQFNDAITLGFNLPQVDKQNSQVTLTLNRSLSGTLLNGLEFLTGYPYGCVEQTMSRALPNAVVAHAANELGEEEQARTLLELLEQGAVKEGDYVSWPRSNEDGGYHNKTMSSSLRTTALVLQAYVEIDPQNPPCCSLFY